MRDNLPEVRVAIYVDDFLYYSMSDEAEKVFETLLARELTVEFMGVVNWFLGCKYEWRRTPKGKLQVMVSQGAYARLLLERHGMEECNPAPMPYRSGLVIDRIPHNGTPQMLSKTWSRSFSR